MTQQKSTAKSTDKNPSLSAAKTKPKTDKQPTKSIAAKRPVSTSKTEKPAKKYTQSEIAFKKSLESLNTLIDLGPGIFSNTSKEKAQDMSTTIVNSILAILKYIPEIKEAELLSLYKKTIKRIASFLRAINLKLESREFSPAEQSVTEDSIITDKNKVQIVKSISPENDLRYVEKYSDGRIVSHTFSISKEVVYYWYCKINPNREVIKSFCKTYSNGNVIEADDIKYEGHDFKLIDSIMIDKNVYADCLDAKFNINLINIFFDINLKNILYENNELRHNISRLKDEKSLKIILTIASSKAIPDNDSVMALDKEQNSKGQHISQNDSNGSRIDNNQEAQVQNTEGNIPSEPLDSIKALFKNIVIYKGKNNLLYSGPKVGKSYFSIEVAKNESIKKALFIILEDFSGDQAKRYEINLGKKEFMIINLEEFDREYDKVLKTKETEANIETIFEFKEPKYHQIKTLNRQNYISYGIMKSKTDKLDRIAVIEKIIKDAIKDSYDFICIDSLHALIEGHGRSFGREEIRRMLVPLSKSHLTLLLLHHTTQDKNKMALTQELRNTFDNIYKLEEIKKYDKSSAELKLIEEEARDNANHEIILKRTIWDNFTVEHEILNADIYDSSKDNRKKSNYKSKIIEILKNHSSEMIQYKELISALEEKTGKENDETHIKGILKQLREEGYIDTIEGSDKYVDGIKIIKKRITGYLGN